MCLLSLEGFGYFSYLQLEIRLEFSAFVFDRPCDDKSICVSSVDFQEKKPTRDSLERSVVREEVDPSWRDDLDSATRQSFLRVIQHFLHDLLLAFSSRDERDSVRVVQDGVRERDTSWGRFRAVVEPCDPSVLLVQERVSREERARVSIRSTVRKEFTRVSSSVSLR